MRIAIAAAVAALTLAAPARAERIDPQRLFLRTCATCHFPKFNPDRVGQMVAPPMDMLSAHVRDAVGDDRAKFVAWVVDWVKAPAEEKSVEPMAVQRFGLMPPIHETFPDMTDAQLEAIAGWIFDEYKDVTLPAMHERQRIQERLGR